MTTSRDIEQLDTQHSVQPVSTIVTRTVPASKVAQFEGLLHEVIAAARTFDGHLGVDVLKPDGGGDYQIVFRYCGHPEQQAWMHSQVRRGIVAQIDELLDDASTAASRTVDGWEGWFVTPGFAPPTPPQRWKMALITLCALYPLVLGLPIALRPLTRDWPLPLAILLTMSVTISLMTWFVMPTLTTRLGSWLRR